MCRVEQEQIIDRLTHNICITETPSTTTDEDGRPAKPAMVILRLNLTLFFP